VHIFSTASLISVSVEFSLNMLLSSAIPYSHTVHKVVCFTILGSTFSLSFAGKTGPTPVKSDCTCKSIFTLLLVLGQRPTSWQNCVGSLKYWTAIWISSLPYILITAVHSDWYDDGKIVHINFIPAMTWDWVALFWISMWMVPTICSQ